MWASAHSVRAFGAAHPSPGAYPSQAGPIPAGGDPVLELAVQDLEGPHPTSGELLVGTAASSSTPTPWAPEFQEWSCTVVCYLPLLAWAVPVVGPGSDLPTPPSRD